MNFPLCVEHHHRVRAFARGVHGVVHVDPTLRIFHHAVRVAVLDLGRQFAPVVVRFVDVLPAAQNGKLASGLVRRAWMAGARAAVPLKKSRLFMRRIISCTHDQTNRVPSRRRPRPGHRATSASRRRRRTPEAVRRPLVLRQDSARRFVPPGRRNGAQRHRPGRAGGVADHPQVRTGPHRDASGGAKIPDGWNRKESHDRLAAEITERIQARRQGQGAQRHHLQRQPRRHVRRRGQGEHHRRPAPRQEGRRRSTT